MLGQRYRIVSQLGRGGMGEVWLAFDLKLKKEVALKSLRTDRFPDEEALDLLRSEVRAAQEVTSPNVCRIYDLVVHEGRELVSMEYVDGETLTGVLETRGPLPLGEARLVGAQLLTGIEAIHLAGLVHRDIKPENIMITRSGRVVLMDFGIARDVTEDRRGTISGTPAYMAPEQIRGEALDGRADVFAAGVVLAEMISPAGIRERSAREALWREIREDPPRLPEGPWQGVLQRAVASQREERFASADAFSRALEEVSLRHEGAEDKHPYPGLASFTEADAEFFFGREAEVEAIWKRLQQSHLLAVIGPSGVGKSSFLHAGLLPVRPEGWGYVQFSPGRGPFVALADVMVPVFAGDTEATKKLLHLDQTDVAVALLTAWRERHDEALLIIDQFEELFTLNPKYEQSRFAILLGRIVAEADVRVLLGMRDDFLYRCHGHEALEPLFREIVPLGPPTGPSLRRAVVQPALACGYRFDDEGLIDELLDHVGGDRGSLPLLAFAMARLWEARDRETGSLTRSAYDGIGGVSGALAQHAEATLSRIGAERQAIVRELFRNLVTAEGTRAARETSDLLSVFPDREVAAAVLRELVGARLVTSFSRQGRDEQASEQWVEVIHESLLSAWPRLVRWQTQDADGAQLRDQLRQAAKLWDERGRSEDLLWTGSAFREFQVWHERYPGGLTALEDSFARAMIGKAERHRMRRRRAAVGGLGVILGVLCVVTTLWVHSERRRKAALASELFALGQTQTTNSAAIAYAIRSLELRDNPEVRRFVLKSLWQGPTALVIPGSGGSAWSVDFSPDGSRLAASGLDGTIKVWSAAGGEPIELRDTAVVAGRFAGGQYAYFAQSADAVVGAWFREDQELRIWSVRERRVFSRLRFPTDPLTGVSLDGSYLTTRYEAKPGTSMVQVWSLEASGARLVGSRSIDSPSYTRHCYSATYDAVDATGSWLVSAAENALEVVALREPASPAQRIGHYEGAILGVAFHPDGERVAVSDAGGIRIWSRTGKGLMRSIERTRPTWGPLRFDPAGKYLAVGTDELRAVDLLSLEAPAGAEPLELYSTTGEATAVAFHPAGSWVATGQGLVTLWPLARRYPWILRPSDMPLWDLLFSPDGRWIAMLSDDFKLRAWSLSGDGVTRTWSLPGKAFALAVDPKSRFLVTATIPPQEGLHVVPFDGGPLETYPLQSGDSPFVAAVGPQGRWIALGMNPALGQHARETVVHLYDRESGESRDLRTGGPGITDVAFSPEGQVLIANGEDLLRWNLQDESHEILIEGVHHFDQSRDGRFLLIQGEPGNSSSTAVKRTLPRFHDLLRGETRVLASHDLVQGVALDPSGSIAVTAHPADGTVRVGPVTGEEPHVLYGHVGRVIRVAVHPNGEWIASGGDDGTLRLWPMPQGQPFHTLPHDEFLARLRSLTNLRVVPHGEGAVGYRLDLDPFPGWQKVPTW